MNQTAPGAVAIIVGGRPASVVFSGLAPGFVGLYQINLQIPGEVPSGANPITVSTKDGRSQSGVFIYIE